VTEDALKAFVTLFVTIGPIDLVPIFIALTAGTRSRIRRRLAVKATLVSGGVLVLFAFAGNRLMELIGVGLPAFRVAGGILLLLLSIDLLFAHPSGLSSITPGEEREAERQSDIAVFPLAIPLIAGPGSMTAILLLMGRAAGDALAAMTVMTMLSLVLVFTLCVLLTAQHLIRLFGVTGVNTVARLSGVMLAALAVQFVLDGLRESRLFK
jgi:multiple antibiotic resistance protein